MDDLDAPVGLRAATLAERASIPRDAPPDRAAGECAAPDDAAAAAIRYRVQAWRSQPPFDRGDWLRRRLADDRLEEASFERLLATPAEALADRLSRPPAWLEHVRSAYAPGEPAEAMSAEASDAMIEDPSGGFLDLLRPLIEPAVARLRQELGRLAGSGAPFDPEPALRMFTALLPHRLLPIVDRTLVLELNVARLEGRLDGATPEERFRCFVGRLRERDRARALLREYPVLARAAVGAINLWTEASLEFLERLSADAPALRGRFFEGRDPGRLAAVDGDAGDSHRGGRSVLIVTFESGERVVYKPRPMGVDARFQELLAWINRRLDAPPFRTLTILDRGAYGWMEHVRAAGCATAGEVRLYHDRLGGLLAILHALEATDVHFENLIAAGDQPVVVDLESLLHPRVPRPEPARPDERLALRVLSRSVLRVGLLPFRAGEGDDFEGIDLSGVASVAGQPAIDRVLQWSGAGTDAMRATRVRPAMAGGRNRPQIDGADVEVADHIDDVVRGFERLYRLLVRLRPELLAPDGPLQRFAGAGVRAVLRPTRTYGLLLAESFHPDVLRDALDRDRLFDRLWVGVEEHPALARVVAPERRALWAGDIPAFAARTDSVDLTLPDGGRIAGFFEGTPLECARRRIENLGEDDLGRQSWLIRLTLGTRLLNRDDPDPPGYAPIVLDRAPEAAALEDGLLGAAAAIGGWFDVQAVTDAGHATWVGLDFRNRRWSLTTLSEDLYAGAPGIALFLAYLGETTGARRPTELARAAMTTLLGRLDVAGDTVFSIGAFQGWGGIIYSLAHLAALWDDRSLLDRAMQAAGRVPALLERDDDLDVVGGAAGAIGALLALERAGGGGRARDAAVRCADRLLRRARSEDDGLFWLTRIGGDDPQTGFSHGAAGIGWALAELGAATGDERYLDAARRAFVFERRRFWPDLRGWLGDPSATGEGGRREPTGAASLRGAPPLERSVAVAWCYGAPGVGLSRLRALRHLDDGEMRGERDEAVRLTVERGFGKNHCLCHGDLGNLDLLAQASRAGGDLALEGAVRRQSAAVLKSLERDGWLCGSRAGVLSPGLMNGLAGIGLGLLRLARPGRVPSVLTLDPPGRV